MTNGPIISIPQIDLLAELRSRRAELVEALATAKNQYEEVEAVLTDLRRSIDMDVGRLAEVDRLLGLFGGE